MNFLASQTVMLFLLRLTMDHKSVQSCDGQDVRHCSSSSLYTRRAELWENEIGSFVFDHHGNDICFSRATVVMLDRLTAHKPDAVLCVQRCQKRGLEHDAPVQRYYERLAGVQARGSHASQQVVRDILKEAQSVMVPRTLLKEWAANTFLNATDYWTFRQMVSPCFTMRVVSVLSVTSLPNTMPKV